MTARKGRSVGPGRTGSSLILRLCVMEDGASRLDEFDPELFNVAWSLAPSESNDDDRVLFVSGDVPLRIETRRCSLSSGLANIARVPRVGTNLLDESLVRLV